MKLDRRLVVLITACVASALIMTMSAYLILHWRSKAANALEVEGFDPAFVAFKEAQEESEKEEEENAKYPDDEKSAFRCISKVWNTQPTEASVKHYSSALRREGLDEDGLCERVRRDRVAERGTRPQ